MPYICEDCGAVFGVPRQIPDRYRRALRPAVYYETCPACLGANFVPAKPCSLCRGGWLDRTSDLDICADCAAAAAVKFEKLLAQNFTHEEIYALNIAYENRPFGMPEGGKP